MARLCVLLGFLFLSLISQANYLYSENNLFEKIYKGYKDYQDGRKIINQKILLYFFPP